LGTPYILDALASSGFDDLAVELLLQTDYPSWGYMVMKGATTMWEHWNSDADKTSMNSFNHYAFGAVVAFMYRRLAGIDIGVPGIENITIKPICDPRLKFVSGDYDSVYGKISTAWRRDGEGLELDVTVPANADATIGIPAGPRQTVREGGRILANRDGMRLGPRSGDRVIVFVGSGTYRFVVR
jgi:alpha-L-rhamnosidase